MTMDQPSGRELVKAMAGEAVLIRKGEAVPANAIPMDNNDVLELQLRRIKQFKPQSEVRMLSWGTGLLSSSVAVSSLIINNICRQNFKLGGLGKMRTYIPVVGVSTLFALGLHEIGIKHSILLGKESCPLCTSMRSGAFQVASGIGYPYIMSILSCLPIAREYYTLPLPEKGGRGRGYLGLLRRVSPSGPMLLFIGIIHAFAGMKIANEELKLFHKYFSHPPSYSEMPIDLPVKNH